MHYQSQTMTLSLFNYFFFVSFFFFQLLGIENCGKQCYPDHVAATFAVYQDFFSYLSGVYSYHRRICLGSCRQDSGVCFYFAPILVQL